MADGETEARGGGQRGSTTCPRPHSQQVEKVALTQACQRQSRAHYVKSRSWQDTKGYRSKKYVRGSGKRQPGLGVKISSWELAELTCSLTLANQSHSSPLPQFTHFTSEDKILYSQEG